MKQSHGPVIAESSSPGELEARPQRPAALLWKRDPMSFSKTAPTVGALTTGLESVYRNRIKLDKRKHFSTCIQSH